MPRPADKIGRSSNEASASPPEGRTLRQAWAIVAAFVAFPATGQTVDPATHWPLPPPVLETRLAAEDFEILEVDSAVGGVTGVKKLRIRLLADGQHLAVKWKQAPAGSADGWNNTPRKEMAAYAIQKWFLEPGDYIVPTIVPRCMPPEHDARITRRELPEAPRPPHIAEAPEHTIAGSRCTLGALVVWLDAVTVPERLHDPERFLKDPVYARHLADFNTLTYLIDHEDGREGNFLVSAHDHHRRIFSISTVRFQFVLDQRNRRVRVRSIYELLRYLVLEMDRDAVLG